MKLQILDCFDTGIFMLHEKGLSKIRMVTVGQSHNFVLAPMYHIITSGRKLALNDYETPSPSPCNKY